MPPDKPRRRRFRRGFGLGLLALVGLLLLGAWRARGVAERFERIGDFMANPARYPDWQIRGGARCGDAPMLLPTSGFIGVAYDDGLPPLYRHTGYDIFSPDGADNVTPIYAAFDGYLTREMTWRSAVIIRHPDFDALPAITGGEQIWTYYTHMASADGANSFISDDFPQGTREKFVPAGTLLGYQGSWSGGDFSIRRHLHFSIVRSTDSGGYRNETRIANTLNPLPFLGLTRDDDGFVTCRERG